MSTYYVLCAKQFVVKPLQPPYETSMLESSHSEEESISMLSCLSPQHF